MPQIVSLTQRVQQMEEARKDGGAPAASPVVPPAALGQTPDKKAKRSSRKKGIEEIEDAPAMLKSLTESLQSMRNSGQKSNTRAPHVSARESADDDKKVKKVMEMVHGVTSMVGGAGDEEEERPVKRSKKKKSKERPRQARLV